MDWWRSANDGASLRRRLQRTSLRSNPLSRSPTPEATSARQPESIPRARSPEYRHPPNTVTLSSDSERTHVHLYALPCFPRSCELRYPSIWERGLGKGIDNNSRIGRADKPKTSRLASQTAAMESLRSFFVKPTPKEQVRLRAPPPTQHPTSRRPMKMAASCAGEHNPTKRKGSMLTMSPSSSQRRNKNAGLSSERRFGKSTVTSTRSRM